ncbi:MAG: hypothetical protein WCC27_17010 [Acidobacteriaceae bacterium]
MTAEIPGSGDAPSFERDIKGLFRAMDREAMQGSFDLWSYDDVKTYATPILQELKSGGMPCDGAWPAGQVALFEKWVAAGMPK